MRLQRVREAGMQWRLWLAATSTHYDHGAQPRSNVFDFFLREENWIVRKTLVAQQRTNAQLNSHIMAPAGNRTGVTLVRGKRFTHKPTVPPYFPYIKIIAAVLFPPRCLSEEKGLLSKLWSCCKCLVITGLAVYMFTISLVGQLFSFGYFFVGHNVHRFTLNLHGLKIMAVKILP